MLCVFMRLAGDEDSSMKVPTVHCLKTGPLRYSDYRDSNR
jgi:hypothetical protein